MKTHGWRLAAVVLAMYASQAAAEEKAETYLLRYKFQRGETIRWEVEHRAQVRTTISGSTQTAESFTSSVKSWKVESVDAQGAATFVHAVDKVDMRQKFDGRQELRFNSETDKEPPPGFADAAKSVGVPLTIFTLDATGKILKRENKQSGPAQRALDQITLPLPEEAVAVGGTWSFPHELRVPLRSGEVKKIDTRQRFTLEGVEDGVATIRLETLILTPIHDAELESQVIQHETNGKARFDIAAGRMVGQQTDLDKRVIGFQGEASSLHYVTRVVERLLPASTARHATAALPSDAAKTPVGPPRQASQPSRVVKPATR